jgi:hypothetical protein
MTIPSVETDVNSDTTLNIPGAASSKDNTPDTSTSVFRAPSISDLKLNAGRLNTAQRVDFSSPSLLDAGTLEWKLEAGQPVSVRIVDTGREKSQERMLFWAGTLGGITASLFFWLGQIVLNAFRMLPSESEE